eukprot:CAMPEP_0206173826 /NCGR_PEP_ID=MMETSP1474-20131121/50225_1 /ASSEMBLY_ACC=CAM_ASM_001110 /TAXON_ID=97495 /ORGANISM="Imantonia sp., Strain RCC918" /LENGTH=252 /DNA_ID=CAMNT_0053582945 /DNA_START=70 /DNA_END=824 /DNA_ORIENTATION=-
MPKVARVAALAAAFLEREARSRGLGGLRLALALRPGKPGVVGVHHGHAHPFQLGLERVGAREVARRPHRLPPLHDLLDLCDVQVVWRRAALRRPAAVARGVTGLAAHVAAPVLFRPRALGADVTIQAAVEAPQDSGSLAGADGHSRDWCPSSPQWKQAVRPCGFGHASLRWPFLPQLKQRVTLDALLPASDRLRFVPAASAAVAEPSCRASRYLAFFAAAHPAAAEALSEALDAEEVLLLDRVHEGLRAVLA